MADADNKEARNKIEAFDLVTEGLLRLDTYQRTSDKSHLTDARTILDQALEKLKENKPEPLYSRAKYFRAMINYLEVTKPETAMTGWLSDRLKDIPAAFEELKNSITHRTPAAYKAELSYNLGAAYYSREDYKTSAEHFENARGAKETLREVRLLAGAGLALSIAKRANELASKPEEQHAFSDLAQRVKELDRELSWELNMNFLRSLWGARHVERALVRKVRALINEAREEMRHISPSRGQTPTAQSGD